MSNKFQYRALLRETALPEMLYSIDRFRVSGLIEARSGPITKRVYLRDGYVIHAASNDLSDSLGESLLRAGKLDQTSLDDVARQRASGGKRVGELLIEQGHMSPAAVFDAIREHIEEIVWSLFYWDDGEVTFSIGEFREEDMVQTRLPMRRVILEGIKRAPEAKPLVERVGTKETILEPSFRTEDLVEIGLDSIEYRLLTSVDGKRTFYELCSQAPLAAADNAKLLYAFRVLHLVSRLDKLEFPERRRPVKIQLKSQGDVFST